MLLAAFIKVRISAQTSFLKAAAGVVTGVLCALVFTRPVLDHLDLDPAVWAPAVAALVAITFEHLVRQLLDLTLLDAIKTWRGGGK